MGNPFGSRAEAAYAKAMTAFQEGSLDVAKRLVAEALADDPHHPGARALRTRIDARLSSGGYSGSARPSGRGGAPEATSVDPTILIDRAADRPPDYIEPTVMIQREDYSRRSAERAPDPFAAPPSRPSRSAPAPEPTVLIPPAPKHSTSSSSSPSSSSRGAPRPQAPSGLQLLWLRVKGQGGARGGRQQAGGLSPTARGALLAIGGLAVAVLLVFGVLGLFKLMGSSRNVLTVTKPTNGTIYGSGLTCGSKGSDCSIEGRATDLVELQTVPDPGYVLTGFTGDCAPSGRVLMTEARTCGATFDRGGGAASAPVAFLLTITKPAGGTIVEGNSIACGTLNTMCTREVPDGTSVKLSFEADKDFHFVAFTGDCGANGETVMDGPKTCGATFQPGTIVTGPVATTTVRPKPGPKTPETNIAGNPGANPGAQPTTTTTVPSGVPATTTTILPVITETKPTEGPETEEQHAKKEIAELVKNYCAALETLDPAAIKKVFPLADERRLRDQYKQYKSLQCTLVGDLEYQGFYAKGAGGAQVKTGMKQVIAAKSGGAPDTQELIVTIVVSRLDQNKRWNITQVNYVPKPK